LSFEVPSPGVTALLGPAGVGKSTLLRTLVGRNHLLPAFWHEGEVLVDGVAVNFEPGISPPGVAIMAQKSRLFTATVVENLTVSMADGLSSTEKKAQAMDIVQRLGLTEQLRNRLTDRAIDLPIGHQRQLTLARIATSNPSVILVDEPERDLPKADAEGVMRTIRRLSQDHGILLVTHDQRLVRTMAENVVFVVAGRQIWRGPAQDFFTEKNHPMVRTFLEQGNCWPTTDQEQQPRVLSTPKPQKSAEAAPSGFHWVIPNRLGGTPRPGLLDDEANDLRSLAALGVKVLVSLEEKPFSAALAAAFGIDVIPLATPDMHAPDPDGALALCRTIDQHLLRDEPVVCHCKGGLGRTGTVLAYYLIYKGKSALAALEEVRAICPRYIQSDVQIESLDTFERAARAAREAGHVA
jgi:atypical dual specificity phosphatase